MTHQDPRTQLIAVLLRLAPDLAEKLWTVRDVRELPADIGARSSTSWATRAAERGLDRDGGPNRYGDELDELAEALLIGERQ